MSLEQLEKQVAAPVTQTQISLSKFIHHFTVGLLHHSLIGPLFIVLYISLTEAFKMAAPLLWKWISFTMLGSCVETNRVKQDEHVWMELHQIYSVLLRFGHNCDTLKVFMTQWEHLADASFRSS